jgi:Na+/proline symporter
MTQGATLAVFVVLVSSYAIAWWSARHERAPAVHQYLYAGNSLVLGVSSSIGSIVSMAIAFTALLSAGFVFGWQILFSILGGGAAGLWALFRFIGTPQIANARETAVRDDREFGASYLAILADQRGLPFLTFFWVAILFYHAMIATELAVLRGFLRFFTELPELELAVLLAMIALVCFSYVFIGGFRGVLVTDYFQLLVVIAFLGLLVAKFCLGPITLSVPSMTTAAIRWTPRTLVLLHVGVFVGTFAWVLANVDQWLRTVGTLSPPDANKALRIAAVVTFVAAIVPILVGSSALVHGLAPTVGNEASLHLSLALWRTGGTTLQFVFVSALTCAALTTLNTYIISIQQLYYEFTVRMVAETHRQYIAEWLLKWRGVRLVGFLSLALAFMISFGISARMVYAVGVGALCGFVFFVPVVIYELVPRAHRFFRARGSFEARALVVSLVIFLPVLEFLRARVGAISVHLYLLPLGAACAAAFSFAAFGISIDPQETSP